MEIQLKIIGIVLITLALIHTIFPKYFNWRQEFEQLSLINKEIMYVHTFFIGLIVLLMGILCLTSFKEILETNLGRKISLGLSIFWGCRLLIQFFGYSSALWRGKKFETAVHILFSILWLYLTTIFIIIYLGEP
ncbi:MAG: hypothetical protein K1X55_00250 [Chitinophagales bacterium]|nr:hypothetical protein [Chitinophagales bacterium]